MKIKPLTILVLFVAGVFGCTSTQTQKKEFEPTFESLEKVNPVPEWFKDAKFGIYFHWGVYSVPAFANEWYPRTMYLKGSPENMHHLKTYGDIGEWPYNNFITGANRQTGQYCSVCTQTQI